jgi:hypothetical protein
MFQICVLNKKNSRKRTNITFPKNFLNAMIKNIKIYKILNIIKISKSMKPNKCIHERKIMKIFLRVFFMNFQSSKKSRCDVPSGTTQ